MLRKRKNKDDDRKVKRLRSGKPIFGLPRGLVPPGYHYMGPGNPTDNGRALNQNDFASKKHDDDYGKLALITGKDPMKHWSDADQRWLDNTEWKGMGVPAKTFFTAKKRAYEHGYISKIDIPQWKKQKSEFQSENPAFKHRRITLDSTSREALQNTHQDRQVRTPIAMEGKAMSGSGNPAGLTETPIDPVGHVFRGPPDYTYASLPYFFDYTASTTFFAHDFAWRPTSVYDCNVDISGGTDINAGAGVSTHVAVNPAASTDATTEKARWFDFYASIYKYYHVVSCRYKIYVENHSAEEICAHLMTCNDVHPPIAATNQDMMCWQDCESKWLSARSISVTANGQTETQQMNSNVIMDEAEGSAGATVNYETGNILNNDIGTPCCVFSGEYRTGDYSRQIHLDANVENWTLVSTNPTLTERILLRLKHKWDSYSANDGSTRDRTLKFTVRCSLEYLVEFKELKDGLKYPINDQPYVATITNTN
nr:MAG: putative capsid protein [Canine parvovirus]